MYIYSERTQNLETNHISFIDMLEACKKTY